jgi:hypothetical protein
MQLQAQTTQNALSTAAEGTQKQFKVLDRRFERLEELLGKLVDQKSDLAESDAKKARGSDD